MKGRLIQSLSKSAPSFLDKHPREFAGGTRAKAAPQPRGAKKVVDIAVQLAGERFRLVCNPDTPVSWLLSETLRQFAAAQGDHPEVERLLSTRTGQDLDLSADVGFSLVSGDCLDAVVMDRSGSDDDDDDADSDDDAEIAPTAAADDDDGSMGGGISFLRGREMSVVGVPMLLHTLCWDDDVEGLAAATAQFLQHGTASPHPVLDRCDTRGNTPLQLALQLGRKKAALVLVQAGADVIRKDSGGWTVLQAAAKLHDTELLTEIVRAGYRQTWLAFQRRLTWLEPLLAGIPDFDLTLLLEVKCAVPLVSRVLPSDRLRIRKAGAKLRIDSSLASLSGKRGSFSTIVLLDDGGKAFFVDHTERTVGRLEKRLMEPTQQQVDGAVNRVVGVSISQAELLTRECTIMPLQKWGKGKQQVVERVGDFKAYAYKVDGGALCVKTRAPVEGGDPAVRKPEKQSVVRSMAEASRRRGSVVVESTDHASPLPDMGRARQRIMSAWSSAYDGGGGAAGFEDYFLQEGTHQAKSAHAVVTLPSERTKTELKAVNGIKLMMAQDFPLSKEMMVSIIDVMAMTSQRFDNVRTFLVSKLPPGFPVAFKIPVAPSLSGAISFPQCSLHGSGGAEIFAVPPGYAMDAVTFPFEK